MMMEQPLQIDDDDGVWWPYAIEVAADGLWGQAAITDETGELVAALVIDRRPRRRWWQFWKRRA